MKLLSVPLILLTAAVGIAQFTPTQTPVAPDGTKAVCDLPGSLHIRNVGGSDGAGLCVFSSVEVASRWQNIDELTGFQKWMTRRPGGGWPQKLDQTIAAYCKEKGVPVPKYLQHTGGDDEFLDLAIKTDRMVCVTYAGSDDFYRGGIAHMVVLAHLDQKWAAIYDNNRPGVTVWMSRSDFLKRWRAMSGGWAVVFLQSPPPPHITATDFTSAQCPNGNCQPLQQSRPQLVPPIGNPPTPAHEWGQFPNGVWGWRFKAKVEVAPAPKAEAEAPIENFGVSSDKINPAERYSLPDGVAIPKGKAHSLMAGDGILDDSTRFHLTVVGDEAFRSQVKKHIDTLNPELKSRLHVQYYSPEHWAVNHFKLPNGISLRKPSPVRNSDQIGTLNASDYNLDRLLDLLRLLDGLKPTPPPVPTPQPVPTPTPTPVPQPTPTPTPDQPTNPLLVVIALIVGLFLIFRTKKDEK